MQVQSHTYIYSLGVEKESLTVNFVVWQAPAGDLPGDDTVTAKFADGDRVIGTCLIGADRPRSRVRQILVGTEKAMPSSVSYIATRILITYSTAKEALHVRSLHCLNAMAVHPDETWEWISRKWCSPFPQPARPAVHSIKSINQP